MSEREKAELKELLGEVFEERVEPKLEAFEEKLTGALRRRNLALITAILCLVAAAFSAGYALNSRSQLDDQLRTNALVVCSSARSTALAFREPQISSDGTKEPRDHFLERMLAQRETLLAAGHIECSSLPGFESFAYQRSRALYEIDQILHELSPKRFPPAHHTPGSVQPGPSASLSPSSGSTAPGAASPSPTGSPAAGGDGGGSGGSGGGSGPKGTPQPNPPPKGGGHEGGGGGNEGGSEGAPGGSGGAGGTGGSGGEGGSGGGEEGGGGEGEQGGGSSNGVVGGAGEAAGEVLCTVDKLTGLRICPQP